MFVIDLQHLDVFFFLTVYLLLLLVASDIHLTVQCLVFVQLVERVIVFPLFIFHALI